MSKVEVIRFNNNYEELSSLMNRVWSKENESYINYSPQFLEYLLSNPDIDPDLCWAAYYDQQLISFFRAKRKDIFIDGQKWSGMHYSLAATHPDFAFYFPYLKIKNKCVSEAIKKGCDLAFGYTALGIKNGHIEEGFAQKNNFEYKLVRTVTFHYLYFSEEQTLDYIESQYNTLSIVPFREMHLDTAFELTSNTLASTTVPLYEKPSRKTLAYILSESDYGGGFYVEHDGITGVIGYLIYDYVEDGSIGKSASLNNIFIDNFDEKIQMEILLKLCIKFKNLGFIDILIEDTRFSNIKLLKDLGFSKATDPAEIFNMHFTAYNKDLNLENLNSTPCYLEIF